MKIIALTAALALVSGASFAACNAFIGGPNCTGLGMAVTSTAPAWIPQLLSVTPTSTVTGSIVFNSVGTPCIVTNTTTNAYVKLVSPATTCTFVPATGL